MLEPNLVLSLTYKSDFNSIPICAFLLFLI